MWTQIIAVAAVLTLYAPGVGAAQSSQPAAGTYQWSAEFVSIDQASRTMTVKSRVAYTEALSALKQFKAGDRVWIVWSGIHEYSDAVRDFRRPGNAAAITEAFIMPAELASTDTPNQYVTIRVRVPEGVLPAITSVKPGEWVTLTSRHRPSTDADAVVAVKPYTSSGTTTSTN